MAHGRVSDCDEDHGRDNGVDRDSDHDHGRHGLFGAFHNHHHHHSDNVSRDKLAAAFFIIAGFMVVEIVGGVISGSLALIADAAHMATDAGSLGIAWWAAILAARPLTHQMTYGYRRAPVIAAFVNGLALLPIVVWIAYEAFERLREPQDVLAGPMLVIAIGGLLVNIVAFKILHGQADDNLNVRAAMLHVIGDLLGSVAAIVAALVIWATGWMLIDPLLSVLVGFIVLFAAWGVLKDSLRILMEGAPQNVTADAVEKLLREKIKGVEGVHHVHVWSIDHKDPIVTLHLACESDVVAADILAEARSVLETSLNVQHATIQIETGDSKCALASR